MADRMGRSHVELVVDPKGQMQLQHEGAVIAGVQSISARWSLDDKRGVLISVDLYTHLKFGPVHDRWKTTPVEG